MTRRPGPLVLLVVVLVVSAGVPVATAATVDPELHLFVPEPVVDPGGTRTLTVQLLNEDDRALNTARTARNMRATLSAAETPFTVESGTVVVGDIADGEAVSPSFQVVIPEDVSPGSYELDLRLRYSTGRRFVTETLHPTVVVEPRPRFTVVSTASDARVGDRGSATLVLANVGSEAVREATVRLESGNAALTFAGDAAVTTVVGDWEPGAEERLELPVDVEPGAAVRPYTIDVTVAYQRPSGAPGEKVLSTAITPDGPPEFALDGVQTTLRVAARGTIEASVANVGETTARDAVVRLAAPWANGTSPAEYAIGDLDPGEAADVRFSATVPVGTDPGPRRISVRVEHAASTGDRIVSPAVGATVEVEPRRTPILAEPVDATFAVDSDGRLQVRLTNREGGSITDLRVSLATSDPLSSDDPTAYVPRLAAGATETVAFHLDVSDDAVPGRHPVALSYAYDDADGTARRVADVPVAVTVVEPGGPGFPVEAVVVVLLAALVGGGWWYRRR